MVLKELGDKKVSPEKLAQKLEEGSEVVKQVYRWVHPKCWHI